MRVLLKTYSVSPQVCATTPRAPSPSMTGPASTPLTVSNSSLPAATAWHANVVQPGTGSQQKPFNGSQSRVHPCLWSLRSQASTTVWCFHLLATHASSIPMAYPVMVVAESIPPTVRVSTRVPGPSLPRCPRQTFQRPRVTPANLNPSLASPHTSVAVGSGAITRRQPLCHTAAA